MAKDREIRGQAGHPEKHGHEERGGQAAQLFTDLAREDRRLPDQNACDERAQDGMDPNQLCRERHPRHEEQDQSHDRGVAHEMIIRPADEGKDDAAPEREADDEKQDGAEDACADGIQIHAAARRQAQRHGDDDPADRVIDDGGGENDLPQIAAREIHLAHHHGDHLDGGDGQSRAEEQRGDEPVLGLRQELSG